MKKLQLVILALLLAISHINAKVKLPSILASHMVLQQNSVVKLWGWSDKSGEVKIKTSWSDKLYVANISETGKWAVNISTSSAGGPYNIMFDDGDRLSVDDVYLGEVWFCSGQSNMEMPVKGFYGQPVDNSIETIANADKNVPIRLFKVERSMSKTPQEDCNGTWNVNSPEYVADFSAAAYFFGKQLYNTLKVPIGLVNSSWGGTNITCWMSSDALKKFPDISQEYLACDEISQKPQPVTLFNGMVNPIKDFNFKGVIWYQGEANRSDPEQYKLLFQSFVENWRDSFRNETMPVYYVQIAPYMYFKNKSNIQAALLREAQMECESVISNVGMVVIMDSGDSSTIHPSKKDIVGKRLAYQALNHTYGISSIISDSPRYVSKMREDNKLILFFDRIPLGITSFGKTLMNLEIAGPDGVFLPAVAKIKDHDKIVLWNDRIKEPVHARYAFQDFVIGDLFGGNGLPVSSFRTDR